VHVFTASGRLVRISQKLAKRSHLLSQQLEWPCEDGEVPELFAPGVSQRALLLALDDDSMCKGLGACEVAEVLDAAENLGVSVTHTRHLVRAFSKSLQRCTCMACRRTGQSSVPEASCAIIDCWNHSRTSHWLDNLLKQDEAILSSFVPAAMYTGRLDMCRHTVQLCTQKQLACTLTWPRMGELFQTSNLHLEDLRNWIPLLIQYGMPIKNFMSFTSGSPPHFAMQQALNSLSCPLSKSSRMKRVFPLKVWRMTPTITKSVARHRQKPGRDMSTELMSKALKTQLKRQAHERRQQEAQRLAAMKAAAHIASPGCICF